MDAATVDHYLDRLGCIRPAAATSAALRELHRAHLRRSTIWRCGW